MIAIDTNVLLRYLLDDDKAQAKAASVLMNGSETVLITDIVLTEAVWTLKGKRYNLDKESIVRVIHSLFEEPNIQFESGQAVWRAVSDYKNAKPVKSGGKLKEADFPDALVVHKSLYTANILGVELNGVYTFDVAAQELPGTKKP